MTDFSFTNADHSAVSSASKILKARYRDYVEYEDVQQELYLWLLSNYDRADRWRAERDEQYAERTIAKALRSAGERYCREEKAQYEGYSPEDEFFYSIPMVADLLQLYFDTDWMLPSGAAQHDKVRSGKPASEGGNLIAMVADVGRAYEELAKPERELLAEIYDGSSVVADAITTKSLEWGITPSAADSRIRRVVGKVRANLGGPDPKEKEVA